MTQRKRTLLRAELSGHELRALAGVCREWASKTEASNDRSRWETKILAFREAMTAGIGKGKNEAVPHELIYQEYKANYWTVKAVINAKANVTRYSRIDTVSRSSSACYDLNVGPSNTVTITRPIDLSKLSSMCDSDKPSDIAKVATAIRLGLSTDSIRKLVGKRRRLEVTDLQSLLASVLLDYCSQKALSKFGPMIERCITALNASNYPAICLFHVLWLAQRIEHPLVGVVMSASDTKKLCKAVEASAS